MSGSGRAWASDRASGVGVGVVGSMIPVGLGVGLRVGVGVDPGVGVGGGPPMVRISWGGLAPSRLEKLALLVPLFVTTMLYEPSAA